MSIDNSFKDFFLCKGEDCFIVVWLLSHAWLFHNPMDWSLAKLSCLWDILGKNTGVDCLLFLQGDKIGLQFLWRWWWLRGMDGIHVCTNVRTCINVHSFMYINGGVLRKEWCWSWSSSTLATWCKELTHWERPWCWERLKAGGEGDYRGWDSWMASLTRSTWVWASSGSW